MIRVQAKPVRQQVSAGRVAQVYAPRLISEKFFPSATAARPATKVVPTLHLPQYLGCFCAILENRFKNGDQRRTDSHRSTASAFLLQATFPCLIGYAQAPAAKASYPAMAPLEQYLMPESAEIALAHSAAPASISGDAEVMVLRRDGYATAVKGKNGFVCIVERAWGKAINTREFWNQKMRAPHCFNPQALVIPLQIYLMKTKLVLVQANRRRRYSAITSALDRKELPPLEPGAMACYDVEAAVSTTTT